MVIDENEMRKMQSYLMLVFGEASSLKILLLGSGYLDTRWGGAPTNTIDIGRSLGESGKDE